MEVFLDGGVRKGTDVLKALALGAKAVFIGRPLVWGLVYQVSHKNLKLIFSDTQTSCSGLVYVHVYVCACRGVCVREGF